MFGANTMAAAVAMAMSGGGYKGYVSTYRETSVEAQEEDIHKAQAKRLKRMLRNIKNKENSNA